MPTLTLPDGTTIETRGPDDLTVGELLEIERLGEQPTVSGMLAAMRILAPEVPEERWYDYRASELATALGEYFEGLSKEAAKRQGNPRKRRG